MTISVLIPTYRRPDDLERCLMAIRAQTHPADEILVVIRENDLESRQRVIQMAGLLPRLRVITVTEPGVVAAMNKGLQEVRTEFFAITDDDAAPHPDWLERICCHFSKQGADLAGVGGKDWLQPVKGHEAGQEIIVGKMTWYGKLFGNHHLGSGKAREVDVLKGVNCAYRTQIVRPIGFDTRLLGSGAQVHWEMSLGLALRKAGWRLIYDPVIAVDHFEGQRLDEARAGHFITSKEAIYNAGYNECLVAMHSLPTWRRCIFLAWSLFLGSTSSPGIIQGFRYWSRYGHWTWLRVLVTQRAKCAALAKFLSQ